MRIKEKLNKDERGMFCAWEENNRRNPIVMTCLPHHFRMLYDMLLCSYCSAKYIKLTKECGHGMPMCSLKAEYGATSALLGR